MIIADRKPLEQIVEAVGDAKNILVAGCGTCVAVCLSGGAQEAELLASELRLALKVAGKKDVTVESMTAQRQCDDEFLDEINKAVEGKDLVVSTACGIGVQFMAEKYEPVRIVPGLNTSFLGANLDRGHYAEYCQACGDCVLEITGGVCPVARCSKSLLNGPCGGSHSGLCEVGDDIECAWQLIYDRLKAQGRLDQISKIMELKNWQTSRDGGPRKLRREVTKP